MEKEEQKRKKYETFRYVICKFGAYSDKIFYANVVAKKKVNFVADGKKFNDRDVAIYDRHTESFLGSFEFEIGQDMKTYVLTREILFEKIKR